MKNILIYLTAFLLLSLGCKKEILYTLNVTVTPSGTGTTSVTSGTYSAGQTVSITATPSPEYIFKGWSGSINSTANPLSIIMDSTKNITAEFEKRQYPLSLTIEGSGTVKEEIVLTQSKVGSYPSGTSVKFTAIPNPEWRFDGWSGDTSTIANPIILNFKKGYTLKAKFIPIILDSIKITKRIDTLVISNNFKYTVIGFYNDKSTKDLSDSVSISSDKSNVTFKNKTIIGAQSGKTVITLGYKNISLKDSFCVNEVEYIDLTTIPYLTTPSNPSAKIIVPVVVVNYYPTLNGIDIDTKRAPGLYSPSPITINDMKKKTIDYLSLTKYGLEEGSKFRVYNNPSQKSNVCFKVVKYINVYEIKRGLKDKQDIFLSPDDKLHPDYQPDYFDTFGKINLKSLVENEGVKEVWFSLRPISWGYPVVKDSLVNGITAYNFLNLPESNMASLTTGDVSNSYRMTNDLPVYNKTYVVYGYNLETSPANNIHNRGHQIEAQFSHIDNRWWGILNNKTDGYADSTRLGCTHKPPNTTKDYDWDNKTLTMSDIEDWKPFGGLMKNINSDRWMSTILSMLPTTPSVTYDYTKDAQYRWLIFWMQSFPGYNNGIQGVNDWWDLFYNWDDAIKNKKKLTF